MYVTPRGRGPLFGWEDGGVARGDAARANRPVYEAGLAHLRRAGLPAGGRVLDVGCARGDFLWAAATAGFDVEGVDINSGLAAAARARGFEVHTGDLRTLHLEATYDLVTLWDVIEHVDDPVALLAACRDVLVPGGLVLFHTGNARFQIPKARLLGALPGDRGPFLIPYQHLTHFDRRSARTAVTAAGLDVVATFFAGTLHYRRRWKRVAMGVMNAVAAAVAAAGGPLFTNAFATMGRRGHPGPGGGSPGASDPRPRP